MKKIELIEDYFLGIWKPKRFDNRVDTNIIIQQRMSYEKLCIAMEKNGVTAPENKTVFQFFTAIDYFEKQKPEK